MEKIKRNSARIILFITAALLVTQCGKKGETKHYRYIGGAEWSPVSNNTIIITKDEYDETVGATSGCGSDPVVQNVRSLEYSIYLADTGETKFKQLFAKESVLPPHQIKWSPRGDRFIIYGGRLSSIYIVDTIGSYIKSDSLNHTYDADWSGDGSRIVCSALRGSRLNPSLQIIDAITGISTQLLPDSTHTGAVSWSINNKIAFVFSHDTTTALAIMNDNGSGIVLLDSSSFFNTIRWSPDGSTLIYSKHLNYDNDVYSLNTLTSTLTHRLHYSDNTQIASIRYSPDGEKMSYYLYRTSSATYLYIMNLSDGNVQQIATDCTDGSWSPDSKQIAYVYYNEIFFKSVQ